MRKLINTLYILFPLCVVVLFWACRSNQHIDQSHSAISESDIVSADITRSTASHVVIGTVMDISKSPVTGVLVSVQGALDSAITGMNGLFQLHTDQAYPLTLQMSHPDYIKQQIILNEDQKLLITLQALRPSLEEPILVSPSVVHEDSYEVGKSTMTEDMIVTSSISRSRPIKRGMAAAPTESMPSPRRGRVKNENINTAAGQLTAAEWNDLNEWQDWKDLLINQDYNEMQEHWQLYPRTRYSVFLKNKYELPIQDAKIELLSKSGIVLWSARSDNAGKAELWTDMNQHDKSFTSVDARVRIGSTIELIEDLKTIDQGVNHIDLDIDCYTSPNVDIVFAVDATGSMGDEIQYLQSELQDVIQRSLVANIDLNVRMGAVFYRDSTDDYVTRTQSLHEDASKTIDFISRQSAQGGGDYPEAVDAALEEALAQDWSEDAIARIIFLLLDAPPHHHPEVLKTLQGQIYDAAKEGIKIIPITASGINRQTEFLMKFMAIATNGTYVFITDHSGIGNPHLDPVVEDYEVEKLNDLLVRMLYNYTKSNGCQANEPQGDGITIYPNPAQDFVYVQSDRPLQSLKVLSNTGKLVSSQTDIDQGKTQIQLSGLVDGLYTIQCVGEKVDVSFPLAVIHP